MASSMEESKEAQATPQVSNPPTSAQTLPSQPPPPPRASAALPPKSKKRPLESDSQLQNSNLFKIRAVIRDLRPHFIEVLRTPDFQNCKASTEICEQLKTLVELCKQIGADVASLGKSKNVQDSKPSSTESVEGKTPPAPGRPSEIKQSPPVVGPEKQLGEDGQPQGTYIVGGSAFGWNFITYSGKEPVYYGVTKEEFRVKCPGPWFVPNNE